MKYSILLVLTLFTMFSCKQTALSYNNILIKPQLRVAAYLDTIFNENTSFEQIVKLRKELVNNADEGLSESLKLSDYEGNSEFKNRAVKYFSFVSNFFADEELDSLFYLLNSSERIKKIDSVHLETIQKDMLTYLKIEDELLTAQKDFANAHKLNLTK